METFPPGCGHLRAQTNTNDGKRRRSPEKHPPRWKILITLKPFVFCPWKNRHAHLCPWRGWRAHLCPWRGRHAHVWHWGMGSSVPRAQMGASPRPTTRMGANRPKNKYGRNSPRAQIPPSPKCARTHTGAAPLPFWQSQDSLSAKVKLPLSKRTQGINSEKVISLIANV